MAISFKKPTWHNEVTVWKWNADDLVWDDAGTITGQLYTPLRNADDEDSGLLYFEYPKEDDLLRDRWDYDNSGDLDGITFSFPTGGPREVGYWVEDVLPRWFGFSNEHLIAVLRKMTTAEKDNVKSGNAQPQTPSVLSQLSANVTTRPADGISAIQFTLILRDASGIPIPPPGPLTIVPSGNGVITTPNPDDTSDGWYRWLAVNETAESETYSVTIGGLIVTSPTVTWTGPPTPPATIDLTMTGTANGSCGSCSVLNDTFSLADSGFTNIWNSAPFAWACAVSGEAQWYLYDTGSIVYANLVDTDFSGGTILYVQYLLNISGWDQSTPLTLATTAPTTECDWPATIDVVP